MSNTVTEKLKEISALYIQSYARTITIITFIYAFYYFFTIVSSRGGYAWEGILALFYFPFSGFIAGLSVSLLLVLVVIPVMQLLSLLESKFHKTSNILIFLLCISVALSSLTFIFYYFNFKLPELFFFMLISVREPYGFVALSVCISAIFYVVHNFHLFTKSGAPRDAPTYNWRCTACDAVNEANAGICKNCKQSVL